MTSDQLTGTSDGWPVVRRYSGAQLNRIKLPVGGIGTGCISFGGRGQLVDWELANRSAKGFTPPNSFFAVRVERPDGTAQTRLLERVLDDVEFEGPHGSLAPNHGLPRFRDATFSAAYPLGQVELSDPTFAVRATVQCFNPLIPQDADASGIPALFYRATITNPTDQPLAVSVCGSLSHLVGRRPGRPTAAGARFQLHESSERSILLGDAPGLDDADEAWGTMALACLDGPADSSRTQWERLSWGDSLLDFWDDFDGDGRLTDARTGAHPPSGSLVRTQTVAPGESADFRFLISWHFPNRYGWIHGLPGQGAGDSRAAPWVGNHYAGRYADAAAVVDQHAGDWDVLERRTVAFVESVTGSDLPLAMQDAALSNLAVLKSPTCFRIADGTFLGWEGCNDASGSCHGSCTHVWNYQYALEALFHDLAWSMRRVEFVHALDERGKMSFRVGLPLETHGTEWETAAADGQMGALVRLHRTWHLSGDDDALRILWPGARRAMEFAWIQHGWDGDADGVMEGCQHNTMDVEYFGPSGVNQSWYLGALAACVAMAVAMGDFDFAERCRGILASGAAGTDARVFNGEYYQQEIIPAMTADLIAPGLRIRLEGDAAWGGSDDLVDPDLQIGSGCTSDQLVGHTMATVGGLCTGLDPTHVTAALQSVARYNHRSDFGAHFNHLRSYALADESGLLVCTYPRGHRPRRPFPYCNEVWTGVEYSAAIGLLLDGDAAAAERVVGDVRDRYDGRRRNPFNEVECGHHYVRSMASWGLVEAWSLAKRQRDHV